MTVDFDQATHHTRDAVGLVVILRRFGGGEREGKDDSVIGIIIDGSLLLGLAVSRPVLGRGDTWAGLSGSLWLVSALGGGGGWRGGRGVATAVGPTTIGLGSELGNSRTGEFVGGVGKGIDTDPSVVVLVGTREADEFVGAGGSGLVTANVDLDTAGVELGTSRLVGQVEGNDLMTEEISTTSEGGRKLKRMGLSVDCGGPPVSAVDQK